MKNAWTCETQKPQRLTLGHLQHLYERAAIERAWGRLEKAVAIEKDALAYLGQLEKQIEQDAAEAIARAMRPNKSQE